MEIVVTTLCVIGLIGLAYLLLRALGKDIKDEMDKFNPFDYLDDNTFE